MVKSCQIKIASLLSLGFILATIKAPLALAQAQPDYTLAQNEQEDLSDPNNLRPLTQADSLLSLQGGKKLMEQANQAINNQQYDLAADKLQKSRQIFNQLSNFYLQLASSFSGIDNRIAQSQRNKALETGQMRDEATYQLALVHRAQNKPELSVPLLIQVIRSQNPTSELGTKAYQQLFEIGFVDAPFNNTTSSN
ncbi:MAG: hypothetical protein D6756_07865 [Cyanobacteria bacterium J083]|nr:MAG: hypothetical protein D6756_07865 [Cyanobacteria bacterium J083]